MAIALLAMFAEMERIYMLERAAGARAAKEARGLPTGRPAKLNATTRAGAAQRIKDGAIPEQVAAELGVSRSTLYRNCASTAKPPRPNPSARKADQPARTASVQVSDIRCFFGDYYGNPELGERTTDRRISALQSL
ncbi:MAG: hypothetical protein QOE54_801 [Streptosporangiaceae bacterium]|jgi:hypothetical protein|nr:hypothetical protein [Streptosporangiaceae bacterium]